MYRNSAVYLVHFSPRLVFVKRSFTCFYRKKLWSCLQNMCFTKRCLFFMIWNSWGVGRWTELYLTLSTWSHQTVPTSTIRKSNPKGENAFLKVCVYIVKREVDYAETGQVHELWGNFGLYHTTLLLQFGGGLSGVRVSEYTRLCGNESYCFISK